MIDKKSNDSRRKLLKSIAAGSGAVVAGKSLPESWSKPVVDAVLLPAHAATTETDATTPCSGCFKYFIDDSYVQYTQGTYPAGTIDVFLDATDCSGEPSGSVQAVEADTLAEAKVAFAEVYGAACSGEFENFIEITCANVWGCLKVM